MSDTHFNFMTSEVFDRTKLHSTYTVLYEVSGRAGQGGAGRGRHLCRFIRTQSTDSGKLRSWMKLCVAVFKMLTFRGVKDGCSPASEDVPDTRMH